MACREHFQIRQLSHTPCVAPKIVQIKNCLKSTRKCTLVVSTLIALPLVRIFFASCLAAKDPFSFAMDIGLVLDSDAAEMSKDILHLGICMAACSTTQVVDSFHADKDEIDHSDDNDAADRVTPDNDSRND